MKILNLGSLNLDKVYHVDHFVQPGESLGVSRLETFCGGKGLNQSTALARAGAEVSHLGAVGADGAELVRTLADSGVDVHLIRVLDTVSGHAVIQITPEGQNGILIFGGANLQISQQSVDRALALFSPGDLLLLQNETSQGEYAMRQAKQKGLLVAMNPSPISEELFRFPLELADYLILNETEGAALSGFPSTEPEKVLEGLCRKFPKSVIVLTLGAGGVLCRAEGQTFRCGACRVPVVDTTAAGDTFCGYFLSGVAKGLPVPEILRISSVAGGLAVSREGASNSIPDWEEVIRSDLTPQNR